MGRRDLSSSRRQDGNFLQTEGILRPRHHVRGRFWEPPIELTETMGNDVSGSLVAFRKGRPVVKFTVRYS